MDDLRAFPTGPDGHDPQPATEALIARQAAQWALATEALSLLRIDSDGLGGVLIKGPQAPSIDRLVDRFTDQSGRKPLVLHHGIDLAHLDTRLDAVASAIAGAAVQTTGLLANPHDTVITLRDAQLISPGLAQRLGGHLDNHRESLLVATHSGETDDTAMATSISDRLALHIQLDGQLIETWTQPLDLVADVDDARALLPRVSVPDLHKKAIVALALSHGVDSMRAPLQALKVARLAAARDGRSQTEQDDLALALALVILPRATRIPAPPPEQDTDTPPPPPEQSESDQPDNQGTRDQDHEEEPDIEQIIEAAKALLPALAETVQRRSSSGSNAARQQSAKQPSGHRKGRPAGLRRGKRGDMRRLNMTATLVAALGKQRVRRRLAKQVRSTAPIILPDDYRLTRRVAPSRITTLLVVDASGSHAMGRLAEAKGAALSLLGTCYRRRDRVGVISFAGVKARVELAPTPAPARAARELQILPSGGGTPLANALDTARLLAQQVMREGDQVSLVLFTDGKANIDRAGIADRLRAADDLADAAQAVRALDINCHMIDTSPRKAARCQQLADTLGASYLHLHRMDAHAIAEAVSSNEGR